MQDDERRRHPRVRLDGRAAGRATVFADFRVVALSETGASLDMALPLALGSTCEISIQLAEGQVDVRARVASVEPAPGGYRVSVDFLSVDEGDQPLLASFLERERRGAP
jgi:hypothetical protein